MVKRVRQEDMAGALELEARCSLMAGMEIKSCVKAPAGRILSLIGIMVLSAIGICRRMMVSETPAS